MFDSPQFKDEIYITNNYESAPFLYKSFVVCFTNKLFSIGLQNNHGILDLLFPLHVLVPLSVPVGIELGHGLVGERLVVLEVKAFILSRVQLLFC